MRQHSRRGARMLAGIVGLEDAAEAVLHHHEHFDGTGCPGGLKGEQIPLLSRTILVADAYDAMTSPRPFRDACSHEEAVARLEGGWRQVRPGGRACLQSVRAAGADPPGRR